MYQMPRLGYTMRDVLVTWVFGDDGVDVEEVWTKRTRKGDNVVPTPEVGDAFAEYRARLRGAPGINL